MWLPIVVYAYNPNCSRDWDRMTRGSKPTWTTVQDSVSKSNAND